MMALFLPFVTNYSLSKYVKRYRNVPLIRPANGGCLNVKWSK